MQDAVRAAQAEMRRAAGDREAAMAMGSVATAPGSGCVVAARDIFLPSSQGTDHAGADRLQVPGPTGDQLEGAVASRPSPVAQG
jgi:hypothetical protein